MVSLIDGLEWTWDGLNTKRIEDFLNVMNKIPLTISRADSLKDPAIKVSFYGPKHENWFVISPEEGRIEYQLDQFKGQGFIKNNFYIRYYAPSSEKQSSELWKTLSKYHCLIIGDGMKAFYLLTEPL